MKTTFLTHWWREFFSESRLGEFQPCLSAQATCQTAHSRYAALRALHALLYTVKRLIVRWHAALFTLLHSCCPVPQMGPIVTLVIFSQIKPFISWQHTKVNHHIYKSQGKPSFIEFTRAWAEYNSWKAGCGTQFSRQQWLLPWLKKLRAGLHHWIGWYRKDKTAVCSFLFTQRAFTCAK